ncbi:MAG: saccharopine dehydrogenase family protein [Dermatophilaceae bacterium]
MSTHDREYDIVLVGATGFVGRLTARHLAEHAPDGVRIGLAGRSRARLDALVATLPGAASSWPVLVVDTLDQAAVAELAARTRVVATTVGPYARYGVALAAACASSGTHYCDLTGEVLFVHDSVARNHEVARESGARIVHACGFDSVPSDLGVLLTVEAARAAGAEPGRTALALRDAKGGFSGGTIDSARTQAIEMRRDAASRRIVGDPYAVADGPPPVRPDSRAGAAERPSNPLDAVVATVRRAGRAVPVRRDPHTGRFTGPFVMAGFNTRIVARTASLLGYGSAFRYSEHVDFGPGPKGALGASAMAVALGVGLAGLSFAPTRALLDRVLPAPGDGPSEATMAAGRFRVDVTTEASDGSRYRTIVAAPYDPGYLGTAVMLGQAALSLTLDEPRLPTAAGVLTPATGIGAPLVERLRTHRFTIETSRVDHATGGHTG